MKNRSSRSGVEQRELERRFKRISVAPQQQQPEARRTHRRSDQTQLQGHDQSHNQPPPPYDSAQRDSQGGVQPTPSNGTNKSTSSERGFSQSNQFHRGSAKFSANSAPSAAGTSNYGGDDEGSEVASTSSSSAHHRRKGKHSGSNFAMPDSDHDSDCTVRGGQRARAPAPSSARRGESKGSREGRKMPVDGSLAKWLSETSSVTESVTDTSSDTESVSTTASDGTDDQAWWDNGYSQGYKVGYEKGCADGSMAADGSEITRVYNLGWQNALKDANRGGLTDGDVFADMLTQAWYGPRHSELDPEVLRQRGASMDLP